MERERELLNKERQLLEDRITDLEAKNLELTQANVSLLEENKALKNEFDRTIKDCLIKVAAGRRVSCSQNLSDRVSIVADYVYLAGT